MAAAVSVGEIEATLRLKNELSDGLKTASRDVVDFGGKVDDTTKKVPKLGDAMNKVADGLKTAGSVLTASVTAPIVAIGIAAVKSGMDAVESENLFSVAFGDMADAARAWSEKTSAALGLNEFELRRNSGTIFTMTQSMGLGKQAAFDMATGMSTLSADLASFFNLKPDEAFDKLRSGIVGEAEPLKALGILVDENTTKLAAYKHGIAEHGTELTQAQKVQARWAAILDQTSKAQGDLGRTLDSPTNQIRIFKERVSEAATKLGMAMMPVIQDFTKALTSLVPYIQSAVKWFADLPEPTRLWVIGLAGAAAAMGPLLLAAGSMITSLTSIAGGLKGASVALGVFKTGLAGLSLGPVAVGIAGITAAVVILRNEWQKELAPLKQRVQAIKDNDTVQKLWNKTTTLTTDESKELWTAMHRNMVQLGDSRDEIYKNEKATGLLAKTLDEVKDGFNVTGRAADDASGDIADLSDEVRDLMKEISGQNAQKRVDDLAKAIDQLGGTSKISAAKQKDLANELEQLRLEGARIPPVLDAMRVKYLALDFQTKLVSTSNDAFVKSVREIAPAMQLSLPAVQQLTDKFREFYGTARDAVDAIVNIAIANNQYIKELPGPPVQPWQEYGSVAKGVIDSISGAFAEHITAMLSGAEGFKEGLKGIWGSLKDAFFDVVNQMFKKFISDFIDKILDYVSKSGFWKFIRDLGGIFNGTGGISFPSFPIPGTGGLTTFATGGVVTGPTRALIGEKGPEAVIPLDRMGAMGLGGIDYDRLGQAVARALTGITVSLDGRRVAEGLLPHLPGVAKRYQLT